MNAAGFVEIGRDGSRRPAPRALVGEAPVALEFNGVSYAVMMATPADLEDFAIGFALTEGLTGSAGQVGELAAVEVDDGWIVRARLADLDLAKLLERTRGRVAESSCGLCGIENLAAVARPLPRVEPHPPVASEAIFAALRHLPDRQTLGRATGAAHAAAWADRAGAIHLVREDVGRHNALDKLIGAAARSGRSLADGFLISTARCSYEIVEKAVRGGATGLVTISLPTTLAVERARAAGLSLWVLARQDSLLQAAPV